MADNTTTGTAGTPQGAGNGSARPLVIAVPGPLTVPVVNRAGQQTGTVEIDPLQFAPPIDKDNPRSGAKINRQLMHEVVLMHLANRRSGTHSTLRRGEVAGSTKKLFRQKGTGNARAGTKRTNKRRGGGTAKGPKPRDYSYSIPKKAVRAATRMAILSKFADGEAVVVDDLAFSAPKTKEMVGVLKAIKVGKRATEAGEKDVTLHDTTVLIGTAGLDVNLYKSARNIEGVKVLPAAEFNCYTVLRQKRLLLTRAALEDLRNPEAAKARELAKNPPKEKTPIKRRGRAARIIKRKEAARAAAAAGAK